MKSYTFSEYKQLQEMSTIDKFIGNLKKNKNIAKCNTGLGNYTSNNSKRLKNLTYDPKRIKEIEELEAKYENALLAW